MSYRSYVPWVDQRNLIKELLNRPLFEGETRYIIALKWFEQWKRYVAWDGFQHASNPFAIDNESLLENNTSTLTTQSTLFVDIPKDAWDLLHAWYGGGPVIKRRVIRNCFNLLVVEYYLLCIVIEYNHSRLPPMYFSRRTSMGEFKFRVCEKLQLDPETIAFQWNDGTQLVEIDAPNTSTMEEASITKSRLLTVIIKHPKTCTTTSEPDYVRVIKDPQTVTTMTTDQLERVVAQLYMALERCKVALWKPQTALTEDHLCRVCIERPKEVAFLPCGHRVTCSLCSRDLSACPICRTSIQQKARVYDS